MKQLVLFIISLMFAICSDATDIKLGNGNYLTCEDQTETIIYNSYRVTVYLNEAVDYNLWGYVKLMSQGKIIQSKPLFITAGQTSCDIDFDKLDNGIRYRIVVKINNK